MGGKNRSTEQWNSERGTVHINGNNRANRNEIMKDAVSSVSGQIKMVNKRFAPFASKHKRAETYLSRYNTGVAIF